MRVLVTGGTGYLGRAVVSRLHAAGHYPVVFARTAASDLPGTSVTGDIRDRDAVLEAARGCDGICHLAALVTIWRRRPQDFDDINVGGLEHVLAAVSALRIPRLLYTSSFLALPPSDNGPLARTNDYQRTKLRAEAVADAAARGGLPVIRMYPGVLYGPGRDTEGNLVGRLVRDHLAGRLPGLVGADRVWSYAWVDDVAAAYVAALSHATPGSRYVVGGENAPQMRVFEILRAQSGRPLPRRLPFAAATALAAVEEARAAITGRPPLLTRGTVEIFRHDWAPDSAEAERDLGYRPRSLQAGMDILLASLESARRAS